MKFALLVDMTGQTWAVNPDRVESVFSIVAGTTTVRFSDGRMVDVNDHLLNVVDALEHPEDGA